MSLEVSEESKTIASSQDTHIVVAEGNDTVNTMEEEQLVSTLAQGVEDEKVHHMLSPGVSMSLQERDNLLRAFIRSTLECDFEHNVWLVKRTYWAYASRRLLKNFIPTRISHWIFDYLSEQRLDYENKQHLATDFDKCRNWVIENVKNKNTHHKIPIFRYVKMIQPKLRSEGGLGHTEAVMDMLGLSSPDFLFWDPKELEKQAESDREIEVMNHKQRQLMQAQSPNEDGTPKKTKKASKKKRKGGETDEEEKRLKKNKDESKDELINNNALAADLANFPPFEVLEYEDSYLVALQVPAIDRSTLEHKISIVGLEISGSCSLPMGIAKKWPGAFEWYHRKWSRQIIFPKPIDPSTSGLVDIQCEGMLFYKCPKQPVQTQSLTNTIKIDTES